MLPIIGNKWDVKYIQILPSPTEGATENIGKGLIITEKFTQCKTSPTLKIDVFEIPDKIKILKNCFQDMNCFPWINLVTVLIHLKY